MTLSQSDVKVRALLERILHECKAATNDRMLLSFMEIPEFARQAIALIDAQEAAQGVGVTAEDAAMIETGGHCPPDPLSKEDVRWAVSYLLEKIARKFDGWETHDIWRSDAALVVRGFKHDAKPLPNAWMGMPICETCKGTGEIDEGLGGEPFSGVSTCPDCSSPKRRTGNSKLVFNKDTKTIGTVRTPPPCDFVMVPRNTLQNIRTFSRKAVYDADKRKPGEDIELFNYIVGRIDALIAAPQIESGDARELVTQIAVLTCERAKDKISKQEWRDKCDALANFFAARIRAEVVEECARNKK